MEAKTFQYINIKLPLELHKKARIKSIETGKTMQEVVLEKMAEWVAETQPAPRETKKASK